MLLNPVSASRRVNGVVIKLDARPDLQIRISVAEPLDFVEVDACVITVVIGKGNVE